MPDKLILRMRVNLLLQQFHPDVNASQHDNPPRAELALLKKLFNEAYVNKLTDENLVQRLKTFLADNWLKVKHTPLCYTEVPQDEVTLLLCEVAEFVNANLLPQQHSYTALSYLMPGVNTERLDNEVKPLLKGSLSKILQTHIVSDIGDCLIPLTQVPIKTVSDLNKVVRRLPSEQHSAYYEQLQGSLPELIKTASDFKEVLEFLSPGQRTAMYEQLQGRLPGLIKTASDFKDVLRFLSREQRTAMYKHKQLQDILPGLTKTVSDLKDVVRFLSTHQRTAVYEQLQARLPELIKTASDFKEVLWFLTLEQCTTLCKQLQARLPEVIETASDFWDVLSVHPPEKIVVVYEQLQARLPELIKTASDFKEVLWGLSPEQRTAVYEQLQARLPELIKTASDFKGVLWFLSPEQRTAVYEQLQARLPELIKTASDFKGVLWFLSPEQRTAVYEQLQARLPDLIKTANDFQDVLSTFTELQQEQKQELYKALAMRYDSSPSGIIILIKGDDESLEEKSFDEFKIFLFNHQLACLEDKVQQFGSPEQQAAHDAAKTLLTTLRSDSKQYFTKTIDYNQFQNGCQAAINEARKVLQHHRGWKDFFAKLLVTIVSLGTIPLSIAAYNKVTRSNVQFGFFKTASEKQVDKLESSVQQLLSPRCP